MIRGLARWLGHPYVVLAGCIALIGSHIWAYGAGKGNGVDQERASQATAVAIAVAEARRTHEAQLRERGWQDAREAEASREARAGLQQRLAELASRPPKTLIKTIEVTNAAGCTCPVPTLGDDFWRMYRAAGGQRGAADPVPAAAVPDRM